MTQDDSKGQAGPAITAILENNINTLIHRRRREAHRRGLQDRLADVATRFAGSMACIYLHLCLFGFWILVNIGWLPLPRFDPSLVLLAMFASVEAIFLSTFVLISQNRMTREADRRADLDLQISLLSEHEITHLLSLVRAIAERMQVPESLNRETVELARKVPPEEVLDAIERQEREHAAG